MSAMFQLAAKDLRLRFRDRSVILTGVVVPFVLAFIFSQILGGADEGRLDLDYGVAVADDSESARRFEAFLGLVAEDGLFTLERTTASDGRLAVEEGRLDALFDVPAHAGSGGGSISVVANVDRPTSSSIAASIARSYAARSDGIALVAATAAAQGEDPDVAAAEAAASPALVAIAPRDAADRQLDPSSFFVAGMAVFFVFFTVSFGVASLLDERREGTMARLLAAPIPRWSILASKAIVSMVLGTVSMAVLIVASVVLLGTEWGHPVGVAMLVLAGVFSAVGIMAIVAAFARTPEGAGNLQAVIAVGLGMLGGVFFPTPLGEGVLASLSLITPHRWFMAGLGDLAGGGGVTAVLPSVGVLVAFGAVTAAVAALRLRTSAFA